MMKLIYFKRLKLNQTNLWPYKRQKKKSWTKLLTIKKKKQVVIKTMKIKFGIKTNERK
jgi:hypothetical protein